MRASGWSSRSGPRGRRERGRWRSAGDLTTTAQLYGRRVRAGLCGQRTGRFPVGPGGGTSVSVLTLPRETIPLRERFAAEGYLPLAGLLNPAGLRRLQEETRRLEEATVRRDFRMECMDDSPRHMTTLGGREIAEESETISALYRDPGLLGLLTALHGRDVTVVEDPVERHVLNILHRTGDTHGAHTDDHPLALVLFIEAPHEPQAGGLLEFNPGRKDLSALDAPGARQVHHRTGDAYLLRSDLTAHRVTPLNQSGTRRTVLNLAYTSPGHAGPTTDSADQLYS